MEPEEDGLRFAGSVGEWDELAEDVDAVSESMSDEDTE
jgi:hypothetical protein